MLVNFLEQVFRPHQRLFFSKKNCQQFSRIVHPQVTPHGISSFFPNKKAWLLTIPLSSLNQPSVTLPYPPFHANHAPASVLFGNAHSLSLAISEDELNDPLRHRRIGSSSLRTPARWIGRRRSISMPWIIRG